MGRIKSRSLVIPSFIGHEFTTYDALGRLGHAERQQGVTTPSQWDFRYDALGNILELGDRVGAADATLSYLTSDRDRICNIAFGGGGLGSSCDAEYDSVGNMTKEPTRTGANNLSYFNTGSIRNIDQGGPIHAHFSYDPFGTVQDTTIATPTVTLRDDRNFGAFMTRRRQHGPGGEVDFIARRFPGAGFKVSRHGATGAPWLVSFSDSRGVQFTANLNGGFEQDNDYSPFGESATTGAQPGLLEYSTESWNDGDALDSLGLVHVGARVYDPVIGRFLSRDPLLLPRTAATSNPYAFAMSDPFNLADPSGVDPEDPAHMDWFSGFVGGAAGRPPLSPDKVRHAVREVRGYARNLAYSMDPSVTGFTPYLGNGMNGEFHFRGSGVPEPFDPFWTIHAVTIALPVIMEASMFEEGINYTVLAETETAESMGLGKTAAAEATATQDLQAIADAARGPYVGTIADKHRVTAINRHASGLMSGTGNVKPSPASREIMSRYGVNRVPVHGKQNCLPGLCGHHAEQRGIAYGLSIGDPVVEQATSGGAKHGGKACAFCAEQQDFFGVRNLTGRQ